MDIPSEILEILSCSSCQMYLSRSPVFIQHDGRAVCSGCYSPSSPAVHNVLYEATAKLLRFPCKYRELGCPQTVPFAATEEEIAHEEQCEYRKYECPVADALCDWVGPKPALLPHCREQHPQRVVNNPCTATHDVSKASVRNYVIAAFQVLFVLQTNICPTLEKIFHSVKFLGGRKEAANFHFSLDVKRNDKVVSRVGKVQGQGGPGDMMVALDTRSLLDALGGLDGASFTVALSRLGETCVFCGAMLLKFLYRDEMGWRCERCTPPKQICENNVQVCTYRDTQKKRWKHEQFFCYHCSSCRVCKQDIGRGGVAAHYASCHLDITCMAGGTWRTYGCDGYRLLASEAGTAVCWYWLRDTEFDLYVYLPAPSKRLSEYYCVVRITDPATGRGCTFTPLLEYNVISDWHISVDKQAFSADYYEFDVCVDITRSV